VSIVFEKANDSIRFIFAIVVNKTGKKMSSIVKKKIIRKKTYQISILSSIYYVHWDHVQIILVHQNVK
jgi:hypothetical protein